jgi:hypothetical protein
MVETLEKKVNEEIKDPSKRRFLNVAKKMTAGYLAVKGIEAIAKTAGVFKGAQAVAGTLPAVEDFLKKYPNATVALGIVYHTNGYDKKSTMSSGLLASDPFAKSKTKNNRMIAKKLYKSGIVPENVWKEMILKADKTIDLALSGATRKKPVYKGNFWETELVVLPRSSNEVGYSIIENIFENSYEGMSARIIKGMNPIFYLQLSTADNLYMEEEPDVTRRVGGKDPTPRVH